MNKKTLTNIQYSLVITLLMPAVQIQAANEAALYDLAPPDSSFIRVVNTDRSSVTKLKVGEKVLSNDTYCKPNDVSYLQQGNHELVVNGKRLEAELKAKHLYTVINSDKGVEIIEEAVFTDKLKGQLGVYNLTELDALTITTGKKDQTVFNDIGQSAYKMRKINPVRINLSVRAEDQLLVQSDFQLLQRGKTNNLFVCGASDMITANWAVQ